MLIACLFLALGGKPRPSRFFVSLFVILYAPFRFAVDFLRTVDVGYFGLTPGQYGCIPLVLVGLVTMLGLRRNGATAVAAGSGWMRRRAPRRVPQ